MTVVENNRQGELEELYLYLLSLKNSESSRENAEKVDDLVKGIINECDFMIKSGQKLSYKFYWIYGFALREYAYILLKQDEQEEQAEQDFIKVLEIARDQLEIGLDILKDSTEPKDSTLDISKHDFVLEVLMMDLQELKDLEIKEVKQKIESFDSKQMLRVGMGIKDYANFMTEEESRMEWNDFGISILVNSKGNKELEKVKNDGIAQCFLSKANYYAESEEDDEDIKVCSNTDKAIEFISAGLEFVQKCLDLGDFAQGFATKGELLIFLSDINAQLGNETESEIYYKEALNDFKKCHELDSTVLPEEFFDLI